MKQSVKKLLSLLLAVVLVVGLLPATALAIQTYPVWVGGVQVDASNAKDVLGDGTVVFTPATESEPARLKLYNADIVGTSLPAYPDDNDGIYSEIDLILELHGTNKITCEDAVSDADSYGIYVKDANLVIEGDGTLDVTAAKGEYSHAVDAKELTMRGGTVRATAGETSISRGVACYAFVMEGGTLEATSGKGVYSYAIATDNKMTMLGGTIRANGGDSSYESAAIRSDKFVMGGGMLEATAGKGQYSYAVNTLDEMNVLGGTIRATGGEGSDDSVGIMAMEFVMEGGTLEATTGKGYRTYGVETDSMTVLGGAIRASAGNASSFCKAVYSNHFTMEGGSLIALGGEAKESWGIDGGGPISGGTLTAIGYTAALGGADLSGYANPNVKVNTEPTELGASAWNGTDKLGGSNSGFKYVKITRGVPFTDVAEGAFYYDAVVWAVGHEPQITTGVSPTIFNPNATCTRAQVVTFLWRAALCPEPDVDQAALPFTDVAETSYYYKAVLWALQNGITKGVDATHFGPNQGCTRGQVVTFLHRAQGTPTPGSDVNPFGDVKAGAFYYNAVLWAVEKNVTKGTSATTFSPNATCTRGQIVTFLYRAQK